MLCAPATTLCTRIGVTCPSGEPSRIAVAPVGSDSSVKPPVLGVADSSLMSRTTASPAVMVRLSVHGR